MKATRQGSVPGQYRPPGPGNDSTPTSAEHELCLSSGERLAEHGAGLDLACPCVVEYDVADPGGLEARRTLSRPDLTPDAIQALLRRLAGHG